MVGEVNNTETRVTGLTPGVLYTFSVSSENDISSRDNNINDRSVSTTATTEEGGGYTLRTYVSYINLTHCACHMMCLWRWVCRLGEARNICFGNKITSLLR